MVTVHTTGLVLNHCIGLTYNNGNQEILKKGKNGQTVSPVFRGNAYLHPFFKLLRRPKALIIILSGISLLFYTYTSVFAGINKGKESQLSIDLGWEQLKYKEHEPDIGLYSNAEVKDWVLGIEGLRQWESFFIGINAIFPMLQGDDREEWFFLGTPSQINTLKYRWIRIDGFIGYPLNHGFNPYGGLRWSESRQERFYFLRSGTPPVDDTVIEINKSYSLLLGIRADGYYISRWELNYWIEYFIPIDVEVTNSFLPDFKASEKDGYTIEMKGRLKFSYTETLSLSFLIYGGRMHWEGSNWKLGGSVKWPENDTDYLGGVINVSWRF